MAQKKFKGYGALKMQLKRRGIEFYGASATYLLEWSLNPRVVQMCSQGAIARGVCKEKAFSEWRDLLQKTGYLTFSSEKLKSGKERWLYYPGPALRPFVTEEKLAQDVVATMSDIGQIRTELNAANKKIATLTSDFGEVKDTLRLIIARLDDPFTEEKFQNYTKNPDKMLRLITQQTK